MKKTKKMIALVLTSCMCVSLCAAPHAAAMSWSGQVAHMEAIAPRAEGETRALPTWVSWAAKTIYWVIRKASNATYSVSAKVEKRSDYLSIESGTIQYNNGTNGSMSYIDVQAVSPYKRNNNPYMDITLSVKTDFLTSLTEAMAVSLTAPNGEYKINQTLGSNGLTAYSVKTAGNQGVYRATFSVTKKDKWSSRVSLYDQYAPHSYMTSMEPQQVVDWENQRYYMIPSESFDAAAVSMMDNRDAQVLSVSELYSEFRDEGMGDFVYSLKSYQAGDKLEVADVISNLVYEEEENRTILEFNTKYGTAYWPFDGNLLSQFQPGDQVHFQFEVISEYAADEYAFENIDYFNTAAQRLLDHSISLDIHNYLM